MSIDGIGVFDLISRNATLEGLFRMEDGDQILPLVEMFLWELVHTPNTSHQGWEGSRATPSCPCCSQSVRLSVFCTDVFPFVCTDFLLLLASQKILHVGGWPLRRKPGFGDF